MQDNLELHSSERQSYLCKIYQNVLLQSFTVLRRVLLFLFPWSPTFSLSYEPGHYYFLASPALSLHLLGPNPVAVSHPRLKLLKFFSIFYNPGPSPAGPNSFPDLQWPII